MPSAVHRGVAFEQRARRLLHAHFSMALRRVGGRADGGVDLLGWWWLPFLPTAHPPAALPDPAGFLRRRLRVLAQCKAEKKKPGPKYVREMEGVWHQHARHTHPTVALLLSESPFSRSSLLHAYGSSVPFLLIHVPEADTDTCTVCPNPALSHLVGPLAFCWETNPSLAADAPVAGRPGLWWQGRKLGSWTPDLSDSEAI